MLSQGNPQCLRVCRACCRIEAGENRWAGSSFQFFFLCHTQEDSNTPGTYSGPRLLGHSVAGGVTFTLQNGLKGFTPELLTLLCRDRRVVLLGLRDRMTAVAVREQEIISVKLSRKP